MLSKIGSEGDNFLYFSWPLYITFLSLFYGNNATKCRQVLLVEKKVGASYLVLVVPLKLLQLFSLIMSSSKDKFYIHYILSKSYPISLAIFISKTFYYSELSRNLETFLLSADNLAEKQKKSSRDSRRAHCN